MAWAFMVCMHVYVCVCVCVCVCECVLFQFYCDVIEKSIVQVEGVQHNEV